MTSLFKYMQKQHARLLLTSGQIRIGTLYEFRDIEAHGDVIGDQEEGKKSLFLPAAGETWTPETIPAFAKSFFDVRPGGSVTLEGISLELPQDSPDFYLFCTTSNFNEAMLRKFGYDACVSIDNPQAFFSALSHTLRHKAVPEGVFKCEYDERNVLHDQDRGVHPALIKDPSYIAQEEVRMIWRPVKASPKPIIVRNRRIAGYCSAKYGG